MPRGYGGSEGVGDDFLKADNRLDSYLEGVTNCYHILHSEDTSLSQKKIIY